MASSHLIALPAQELAALLNAANAPQHAALFAMLPAFRAALLTPIDDNLLTIAGAANDAIREVLANTNYPEDWDDARAMVDRLIEQKRAQRAAQAAAPAALPTPTPHGNKSCPCCAGKRIARVQSKACNLNWFDIPHIGFKAERCYMPSDMGIPSDGDGPQIEVCLDCGRVVNGVYPLPEPELLARVAAYKAEVDCDDGKDNE